MSQGSQRKNQKFTLLIDQNQNKNINRQSLGIIKNEKKQIEENAKLLSLRIAMLKQEEQKTVKRIEDTKKKAYQIYKSKVLNQSRENQKQILKEISFMKQKEAKQMIQMQQIKKNDKKQHLIQEKTHHYELIKQEKEKLKEKKELNDKSQYNNILQKYNHVKEQLEQGRQKIDNFQIQKRLLVQQEYAKQFDIEDKKKKDIQKNIENMEQIEWKLIQKLQNTQNCQKQAYQELEDAINLSIHEFEEKFINNKSYYQNKSQDQIKQIKCSNKLPKIVVNK